MDTWTCDLVLTIATVLTTMLFEQQLLPLANLLKALECKNLFGRLFQFYQVLVPRQTPPVARRVHYEDETRNQPSYFSRARKTLRRGKGGRLRWHLSKRYLEQLNNTWNNRYAEAIRNKSFVVYENETTQVESPGDFLSQCLEHRRVVKWTENNEVRLFELNKLPTKPAEPVPAVTGSQHPKPILKKPLRRKRVPQVKPVSSEPVKQETQRCLALFFKHTIKSMLRSMDNTKSCDLNDVELGLEPRAVRCACQFQHVTGSPLLSLGFPKSEHMRTHGDFLRSPEEVV